MQSNTKIWALVVAAGMAWSCSQFKTQTTEDGLKYTMHHDEEKGKLPKEGDILTFHLIIKTPTDSVLQDTHDKNPYKMPFQNKASFKGSFEKGLGILTMGDSATFYVSADSIYQQAQQPLPQGMKPGSDLKFIVKMISIQTREEFENAMRAKQKNEKAVMAAYVNKNLPGATTSPLGVSYMIKQQGTGPAVAMGDTIYVDYTGRFLDGKVFDTSIGKQPMGLLAGMGMVIKGWDEMLVGMKKGEKRTVVIPSELAYGDQGNPGGIEPFTTITFDMELKDLKKKK